MKQESIQVFMCGVDFQHHLENDSHGTTAYPDVDSLKARHKCWPSCGIVAVRVTFDRWVEMRAAMLHQMSK